MASDTDPVQVAVELLDSFSDELDKIDRKLNDIDGQNLTVLLDINDKGEISSTKARLEMLEEQLEAILNVEIDGYGEATTIKEILEEDMESTLVIDTDKRDDLDASGESGPSWKGVDPPPSSDRITQSVSYDKEGGPPRMPWPDEIWSKTRHRELNNVLEDGLDNLDLPDEVNDGSQGTLYSDSPDLSNLRENFLGNHLRRRQGVGLTGSVPGSDRVLGEHLFGDLPAQANQLASKFDSMPDGEGEDRDFPYEVSQADLGLDASGRFPYDTEDENAPSGQARISSYTDGDDTPSLGRRVKSKIPGLGGGGRDQMDVDLGSLGFKKTKKALSNIDNPFEGIGKTLLKYRPTMQMWWQFMAALLPLMIALGGAALGLAASLGAVAGAGAAIAGLGLLGLEDAEGRIKKLKEELGDALQPAGETFEPFVKQIMGQLPNMVSRLVEPLQGLQAYEGFFQSALSGGVGFIKQIIEAMVRLEGKITQLATRFGRFFGEKLLQLLVWSVNELYNNQDAFMKLAKVMINIGAVIYQISKIVAFFFAQMSSLTNIFSILATILSNDVVAGILSGVAAFVLLSSTVMKAGKALMYLRSISIIGYLGGIARQAIRAAGMLYGYVGAANAATAATRGLAAALALTGVGAVIAGTGIIAHGVMTSSDGPDGPSGPGGSGPGGPAAPGGMSMPAGSSPGGGGTVIKNQMIVQGDIDERTYEEAEASYSDKYERESNIEYNTNPANSSWNKGNN